MCVCRRWGSRSSKNGNFTRVYIIIYAPARASTSCSTMPHGLTPPHIIHYSLPSKYLTVLNPRPIIVQSVMRCRLVRARFIHHTVPSFVRRESQTISNISVAVPLNRRADRFSPRLLSHNYARNNRTRATWNVLVQKSFITNTDQ